MKIGKKIAVILCMGFLFVSCRNDDETARRRVEKLVFEEGEKELYVGDTVYVNIGVQPPEAKNSEKIIYQAEKSGVIEILPESNNSSVVFKGLKRGRTVIFASANGIFGYLTVNVIGGNESVVPHIVLSDYVFECFRGESRSVVASLRGGTPLDDNAFVWSYSNENKQIISFESTNNVGVFETKNAGESLITVSHPKARFSAKILVFVKDKDEVPVYITTDNNVINLKTSDNVFEYMVNLYGSNKSSDNYYFEHIILEGESVIGLKCQNNIGTITPKTRGIARIGVHHRDAGFDIEIIVVVTEEIVYNYIDVDNSLIIMEENHIRFINAVLIGDTPDDHLNKYEFINENDNVVQLEQTQNVAKLSGLKKGKSIITVKNEYADFEREILVIVNGAGETIDNSFYITTNQNVITTEVNGEAELTMSLVGGNSADANNFIWTVEDGSIIDVRSSHGEVRYTSRAVSGGENQSFKAVAYIKAKKVGTTKITIENSKAKNNFSVIVKVYKQGVFGVVPVVLQGQSLYRLNVNETVETSLRVMAGLEKSLANIEWISDNPAVFSVENSAGLTGVLKGKGPGVASLTVKADNLKNYYVATVIVGDDFYLRTQPYMYVVNPFMSITKGNSATFRVECTNMSSEQIANLSVVNNDPGKMEIFAHRNNVTVTGIALGEGNIVISGDGLKTLIVNVLVEEHALTPDMPFYLRANKYIYGVVKDRKIEVPVDLVGGIAHNEKNITWNIADSNVAVIEPSGKKCLITGKNEGQTVLTASHAQSNNTLEIVIYVVLNDNELNTKIIMHVSRQNILLTLGQTRYISIITNASSARQNAFSWDYTRPDVIGVAVGADKIKAYVTAKGIGNAAISVRSGDQIPLVIYVSVMGGDLNSAYINAPSIVEMVVGQTININAVTSGIHDKYSIGWKSKNETVARAYGNGDICTITAYKDERTVITVTYNDFVKNILLCVYKNTEEMANAYVFAAEQSRYVINKDDVITVNLAFGMKGYPEHMRQSIRWATNDSIKIGVEDNGSSASIRGLNAGVGVVNVSDDWGNNVDIEIAVREFGKVGGYSFSIKEYGKEAGGEDRIVGVVAGGYVDLEVKVFNGAAEITNISGIEYDVGNKDILSIEHRPFGVRVRTKAGMEGSGYITLRHDLIDDARILVYTALSEMALNDAFPLLINKVNYLIKKGESVTVNVTAKPDDGSRLRNISYDLEKDNGVIMVSERDKTEIIISARKAGSDIVLVRYNAEIVQRIYISVVEDDFGSSAGYIVTESIIGIIEGNFYETRIDTNIITGISWRSDDAGICGIQDIMGHTARIKGIRAGATTITVKSGSIERKIAVFVARDQDELNALEAVNIEQRKYQIRKNNGITINIRSYQGRVEGKTEYEDYYKYSVPYGNVISVNFIDNGKLSVKGLNDGVAAIRITNDYYQEEFVVYVEVYPDTGEGGVSAVNSKHYITAEKTLYIIGEEEKNVYVSVNVVGDDFLGDNEWVWQGYDGDIIEVNALGRNAVVNPLRRGSAKLQVINGKCENNPFEIVIIVGDRFEAENGDLPYISVERDLYEAVKNSGDIIVPYSIVNAGKVDAKKIFFDVVNGNIEVRHDAANGVFNVTPKETGIAKFVIKYGDLSREVYVLVRENLGAGAVYLTTSENFVVASIGELRNIRINLVGYNELDSGKLKWSVSDKSPRNVIQLSGNGTIGEIYGVSEGDVVVNITHLRDDIYRAFNTLTINVRIVKDKSKENIVYLTTQKNVVEVVKGSQSEIIYARKVGGDINNSELTWNSLNKNIVTLDEIRGNAARILAHSEGEARITVSNSEARYELEITVIVRDSLNNNIYISSDDTLLWLNPGEKNRRISAVLVNGDVKYNNNFVWTIEKPQLPSDEKVKQARGNVINIIPSNDVCLIDAVNEGVAYIRVENPGKAEKALIITVYVSHYKEIKFSTERKEVIIGEYEFVELEIPTYEYLQDKARVWVEDLNGDPTDLLDVYFTNSLILLNGREEGLRGRDDGFVIVKAALEGKNSYAQMLVHIVKKADPNVNRIVVGKNIYVTSLKAENFIINASATGPDIFDVDLDNLRWGIVANDNGDSSKPYIAMIPQGNGVGAGKNGEKFYYHSSGRQVQISVKNEGTAVLRIMHEKVPPEYWKDIYIIIEDLGNYFTIEKKEVSVNMSRPETVSVNIVGGTTQDYSQVKWIAKMQQKWDGTLMEIVRIMGSGREVTLYPMNDGETEVYAFFNGKMVSCKVAAFSDYYLSFRSGQEYMFPGETRDIPFDIRPANSNLNWIPEGAFLNDNKTKVIFSHVEITGSPTGGVGSPQRMLRIIAENEGGGTLVAMANGKLAQVNIIVAYDYQFAIDNGKSSFRTGCPLYNIDNDKLDIKFEKSSDGVIEVGYYVYPANTYIEADENTIPDGLTVEVKTGGTATDSKGRTLGTGIIKFTSVKEMSATVRFQQYKAMVPGGKKEAVDNGERPFSVEYAFPDQNIFPYFMRGDGVHSNTDNHGTKNAPANRGQYELRKNGKYISGGENITKNRNSEVYELDLMDGEVHHILFDKLFENMNVDNISIKVSKKAGSKNWIVNNGDITIPIDANDIKDNKSRLYWPDQAEGQLKQFNFSAKLVDVSYDGIHQKAIRLSGGKDYIEYTRVGYPQELFLYTKTAYAKNNVEKVYKIEDMDSEKYGNVPAKTALPRGNSPWYQAYQGDFYSDGEANTGKTYYLLSGKSVTFEPEDDDVILEDRLSLDGRFSMKEIEYIDLFLDYKNIEEYPYLAAYVNDNYDDDYIYFLDGTEKSSFMSDDPEIDPDELWLRITSVCQVDLQDIEYYYTYEVYRNNISVFNSINNNSYYHHDRSRIVYNDNNMIIGGYFVSTYALNDAFITNIQNTNRTVYRYESGEILLHLANDNTIYCNNNIIDLEYVAGKDMNGDDSDYIKGWNYGYFNDRCLENMPSQDGEIDYIYSTYPYQVGKTEIVPKSEGEMEAVYDVFGQKQGDKDNDVYLDIPQYGGIGAAYQPSPKKNLTFGYVCLKKQAEYINYVNMAAITEKNNIYFKHNAPDNTGNANRFNIFAQKDGVIDYGKYSDNYKVGATYQYHYTGVSGVVENFIDIIGGSGLECKWKVEMKWKGLFNGMWQPEAIHPKETKIVNAGGSVYNMLKWEDTGKEVVAPYNFFNRFPFRYVGSFSPNETKNIVRLGDGGGRPMPSVSRENKYLSGEQMQIAIEYRNFNNKLCSLYINVNLYIKPCHSEYKGSGVTDDMPMKYPKDKMPEKEGERGNFDKITVYDPFIE